MQLISHLSVRLPLRLWYHNGPVPLDPQSNAMLVCTSPKVPGFPGPPVIFTGEMGRAQSIPSFVTDYITLSLRGQASEAGCQDAQPVGRWGSSRTWSCTSQVHFPALF